MSQLAYVRNKVIHGFGRGSRELGCPTANVDGIQHLTLPTGIYCGLAQLIIHNQDQVQADSKNEEAYEKIVQKLPYVSKVQGMVASFGFNPQYGNKERSLEVHILEDFGFNFYGAELRVLICKKMRDEKKYNTLDELKDAIASDIRNAKNEVSNYKEHTTNTEYFHWIDDTSR